MFGRSDKFENPNNKCNNKNLKMINDINTLKSLLTISERIVLKKKEGN